MYVYMLLSAKRISKKLISGLKAWDQKNRKQFDSCSIFYTSPIYLAESTYTQLTLRLKSRSILLYLLGYVLHHLLPVCLILWSGRSKNSLLEKFRKKNMQI